MKSSTASSGFVNELLVQHISASLTGDGTRPPATNCAKPMVNSRARTQYENPGVWRTLGEWCSPGQQHAVVWAVAKGSLMNKVILVPTALLVSAFVHVTVTPLLMIGSVFVCFEWFGTLAKKWLRHEPERPIALIAAVPDPTVDLLAFEQSRFKGGLRAVAGIVKLDDLGLHPHRHVGTDNGARRARSI
jgi:hypothetical protein